MSSQSALPFVPISMAVLAFLPDALHCICKQILTQWLCSGDGYIEDSKSRALIARTASTVNLSVGYARASVAVPPDVLSSLLSLY